jgi:hypothetical protein
MSKGKFDPVAKIPMIGRDSRIDVELRIADHMNLPFADSQCLQRVVIFLWFGCETLDATARTKGVGELPNGENSFAVQPCSFLVRQIGEEAEIVFLDRFLSAVALEPALRTMSVQDEIRRSRGGQQSGDLADGLIDYAR